MDFQDCSQGGETAFLAQYFATHKPTYSTLVDIGAFGRWYSNSWGLLALGWTGTLVEANPDRVPAIQTEFEGLRYTLVNCAVGDESVSGTRLLQLRHNPECNSLVDAWAPVYEKTGDTRSVKMKPITELLREQQVPKDFDLLCIDVEGMDRTVVSCMLGGGWRPRVILTELPSYGGEEGAVAFFAAARYGFLNRFEPGNPYGNMAFERRD